MKLSFGRLKLAEAARAVPDPWGFGWVFLIRRLSSRQYQELLKERQSSNPLMAQLVNAMARAQGKALLTPESKLSAEARADKAIEAKERQEIYSAAVAEEWDRRTAGLNVDPDQAAFAMSGGVSTIDEAFALIAGWPTPPLDANGEPLPFTAENVRELLAIDDVAIPDGEPYAGEPLGKAIALWVRAAAGDSEAARAGLLEAASGNSEPSSDGVADDSKSSPAPSVTS